MTDYRKDASHFFLLKRAFQKQANASGSPVSTSCVVRTESHVVTVIITYVATIVEFFQLCDPDGYRLACEWLPTGI